MDNLTFLNLKVILQSKGKKELKLSTKFLATSKSSKALASKASATKASAHKASAVESAESLIESAKALIETVLTCHKCNQKFLIRIRTLVHTQLFVLPPSNPKTPPKSCRFSRGAASTNAATTANTTQRFS